MLETKRGYAAKDVTCTPAVDIIAHMVAKHVKSEEWKYASKGMSWWWIFDPLEQPYGMEQAPKAHAYAAANKRLRDA